MRLNQAVAKRYASSLFQLSNGSDGDLGKPQLVLEELKVFQEALSKDRIVESFFLNPTLSKDEKKDVLQGLESKLPSSFRFICVLVEADRIDCFQDIVAEFTKLLEESAGEMSVELTSAQKLEDSMVKEIFGILETRWKRKPRFEFKTDPKILGGFVAKAPGRIYDASLRSQLRHLERSLSC